MYRGESWFRDECADLDVRDAVGRPGTGPVGFVTGAFDPERSDSVFVIPRYVLGRDAHGSWLTCVGDPAAVPVPHEAPAPGNITYSDGNLEPAEWETAVAEAVRRIRDGQLDKVVLARDVVARTADPIDVRYLIARLTGLYPTCWTYAVDGLVGATPELLVQIIDGHLRSRVLAGTEWGDGADERLHSAKNLEEHAYAAQSAAASLEKVTVSLDIAPEPTVLALPNLVHLATDITGEVAADVGPCQVAAAMHPTAAVGGTPTDLACRVITELECMNRGGYAGPVGWMDSHGNGEFGIALRGGQIRDERTIQLFAGNGIVAGSDPEKELAETVSKLLVMREALEPA